MSGGGEYDPPPLAALPEVGELHREEHGGYVFSLCCEATGPGGGERQLAVYTRWVCGCPRKTELQVEKWTFPRHGAENAKAKLEEYEKSGTCEMQFAPVVEVIWNDVYLAAHTLRLKRGEEPQASALLYNALSLMAGADQGLAPRPPAQRVCNTHGWPPALGVKVLEELASWHHPAPFEAEARDSWNAACAGCDRAAGVAPDTVDADSPFEGGGAGPASA